VLYIHGRPSHGENEAEMFIIAILGGNKFFWHFRVEEENFLGILGGGEKF